MVKYRKKPVVIDAIQWDGENVPDVYAFLHGKPTIGGYIASDKWDEYVESKRNKPWVIKTLEDGPNGEAKHVASVGDWIICGVQGEFYPCKTDIFEATYERVQ